MSVASRIGAAPVAASRHVVAILCLPLMNTVIIPCAIVRATGGSLDAGLWATATAGGLALSLVGAALLAAGVYLAAHSIAWFVRVGHGTLAPWDPAENMVTRGAYRYIRNPMKAGLFLTLLAEAILLRSSALLAWFTIFALVNVVYIRVSEEPGLRRRFGADYERYCASVPRWIPKLPIRNFAGSPRGRT